MISLGLGMAGTIKVEFKVRQSGEVFSTYAVSDDRLKYLIEGWLEDMEEMHSIEISDLKMEVCKK
jgi:hypothetical protein